MSRRQAKKKTGFLNHLKSLGFTNRLAILLVILLIGGFIGSFILAWESIQLNYLGALPCWTVIFTPIGTALSIVLGKIVNKSKAENIGADGTGISYALAMQDLKNAQTTEGPKSEADIISPPI